MAPCSQPWRRRRRKGPIGTSSNPPSLWPRRGARLSWSGPWHWLIVPCGRNDDHHNAQKHFGVASVPATSYNPARLAAGPCGVLPKMSYGGPIAIVTAAMVGKPLRYSSACPFRILWQIQQNPKTMHRLPSFAALITIVVASNCAEMVCAQGRRRTRPASRLSSFGSGPERPSMNMPQCRPSWSKI